jgi:hypothetical protein
MCENVIEFKTKDELVKTNNTLYIIVTSKNGLWYAVSTLLDVNDMEDEIKEQLITDLDGVQFFSTKELCLNNARVEAEPFEQLGIKVQFCSILI